MQDTSRPIFPTRVSYHPARSIVSVYMTVSLSASSHVALKTVGRPSCFSFSHTTSSLWANPAASAFGTYPGLAVLGTSAVNTEPPLPFLDVPGAPSLASTSPSFLRLSLLNRRPERLLSRSSQLPVLPGVNPRSLQCPMSPLPPPCDLPPHFSDLGTAYLPLPVSPKPTPQRLRSSCSLS
ncbi:hypothetical protein mRhiFer1_009727 [Rhinolophus ferrumequinum]|uniref:Uncharacterized protein n=1 Tax=Rhinolophus ferrumequinum TaxID=59479 RepID=A0A7J7ZDG3_RHIFE|nr:hypothetical protein mRhiFer1_009727 [Rhinolophus ferrumequinum]